MHFDLLLLCWIVSACALAGIASGDPPRWTPSTDLLFNYQLGTPFKTSDFLKGVEVWPVGGAIWVFLGLFRRPPAPPHSLRRRRWQKQRTQLPQRNVCKPRPLCFISFCL